MFLSGVKNQGNGKNLRLCDNVMCIRMNEILKLVRALNKLQKEASK